MSLQATLKVERDFRIGELDRRMFGVFVEHLGRCVYTGVYEPDHPTANEQGFRQDVLDLTRELGATLVRYPGGNFMSGYMWEDGVGPKEERPRRLDLAWFSTETNQVGTHEFMSWCRELEIEPLFGANLGTRGMDEARQYLEYCNHPGGTALSDLRHQHGHPEPLGIKLWCLGNEMDGPWQIGRKTPAEYGRLALETGKLMRMVDPEVRLAVCGSSAYDMPTYGVWEDQVLEHCYEVADYLSLHSYFVKPPGDTSSESFFAQIETNARYIEDTVAIADAVAARKRSTKKLMLSFDEWNVWYRARHGQHMKQDGWREAPRLLEEVYTAEDALLVGGMLTMMMNHADRLKIACLAQLVNVIAPIMTEPGGPAWRQTIFHPFAQAARHARGQVLKPLIQSPGYANARHGELPYLCASVTHDDATGRCVLFLLNRNLREPLQLDAQLAGLGARYVVEAWQLRHEDLEATNTMEAPDRVAPVPFAGVAIAGERLSVELAPASWTVIVTEPIPS